MIDRQLHTSSLPQVEYLTHTQPLNLARCLTRRRPSYRHILLFLSPNGSVVRAFPFMGVFSQYTVQSLPEKQKGSLLAHWFGLEKRCAFCFHISLPLSRVRVKSRSCSTVQPPSICYVDIPLACGYSSRSFLDIARLHMSSYVYVCFCYCHVPLTICLTTHTHPHMYRRPPKRSPLRNAGVCTHGDSGETKNGST